VVRAVEPERITMFDTVHTPDASACAGETAVASSATNTPSEEELLSRAKDAVEAGEQSLRDAAEALGIAQELHGTTQAEMARAIGKSEAWASYLLRWRRSGYKDDSPFGPKTKAGRLKHAEDRVASGTSKPRKSRNRSPDAAQETSHLAELPGRAPAISAKVEVIRASEAGLEGAEAELSSVPEPQGTPTAAKVESASAAREQQTVRPAKSRSTVPLSNKTLYGFDATVRELIVMIGKRETVRFSRTSVSVDELARAGKFLTDLANLKETGGSKPTAAVVSCGKATVSPEQSAEERKATYAALEEQLDLAA
jgi:hypothetical protein